ncbi:MAG: BlaI/MecI/CopY family transcriptional regulator [Planctomycetaceae bacterium]|jgi:BlaI family transcriptional regulator, penicillinase repressor|nr:BlaI/MecI/CopY family transcriptional regulator [Planctomycetaceae bacterium]MBT6153600.1 BlaI/MecI/CopY family transcriptional regulator [Planctomycetaceae bacterium]MBT6487920.1 BlaI/MecI/CopY family transcriptional regulator [Planctomycetaceae bacterium]MBT6494762.1 BlaI/MecI/CopY family transcriptional regulator [Planctomycetaceae bacterium]
MSRNHQLARLQLAIMQVLWDRGEATVAEVRDALEDDRPLAYTTVATMLTKMERNGQVAHRTEGRVHVYRPALHRERVSQSMVADLAGRLFDGNVTEMVSHLLDGCDVSTEELARLKTLIRQKEREVKDDD